MHMGRQVDDTVHALKGGIPIGIWTDVAYDQLLSGDYPIRSVAPKSRPDLDAGMGQRLAQHSPDETIGPCNQNSHREVSRRARQWCR